MLIETKLNLDFIVRLVQVHFAIWDQIGQTEGGRARDAGLTMDKDLAVFGFYVIDERNRLIEVRLFRDRYEYPNE